MEEKEHKSIVAVMLVIGLAIWVVICIAYKFIEWFFRVIPIMTFGFFRHK